MREVTCYVSFDDYIYGTEERCLKHEEQVIRRAGISFFDDFGVEVTSKVIEECLEFHSVEIEGEGGIKVIKDFFRDREIPCSGIKNNQLGQYFWDENECAWRRA